MPVQQRGPLLVRIGEVGVHPSFSGTGFFVTKFVRRGGSHNPTHISQNVPHALVYIAEMQGGPHILIVDDHREIRDLVSRALTKEGFRVSTAADGRAMQKVLADSRIDLILLDLMLPGEDGLSLCRDASRGIEHPDHHADRQGRGGRPRHRPGDGRRRLPLEAFRQPRADRADQSRPAPQPGNNVEGEIPSNNPRVTISTAGVWTPAHARSCAMTASRCR